jgi:hypothetical protein
VQKVHSPAVVATAPLPAVAELPVLTAPPATAVRPHQRQAASQQPRRPATPLHATAAAATTIASHSLLIHRPAHARVVAPAGRKL